MRSRTLLLSLVAVLLVGVTFYLAKAWLNAQRSADMAEASPLALPAPSKSVLVARVGVQRGQILKPDDLVWQVWPEGTLDKSYIILGTRTPESFAGWVARNPIAGGEPMTESKIIAPGNRGFLAAVLRPGMRAISVPVTVTTGISGFVFPGDQVDLLITYQVPVAKESADSPKTGNDGYQHKAAETVLHDVRVIAIDQRLESKAGEAAVAHTATLEVTPKQSEVIALASEIGKLSLSLRSLVPAAHEKPLAADSLPDQLLDSTANRLVSDSSSATPTATFTLDSEISPLFPKSPGTKGNSETGLVTILRGGGKGADVVASQPASRGS
jgi:pilus assembly protein CpaB